MQFIISIYNNSYVIYFTEIVVVNNFKLFGRNLFFLIIRLRNYIYFLLERCEYPTDG